MSDDVFVFIFGFLLLLSVAAAVDAVLLPPQVWQSAGHSQKFRFLVASSPLLYFFCLPVGLGFVLVYLLAIRRNLGRHRKWLASQGRLPARRLFGFGATWSELSGRHKVKVLLAAAIAAVLAAFTWPAAGLDISPWEWAIVGPVSCPAFFFAAYLALWFARLFIPAAWQAKDNVTPAVLRMQSPPRRSWADQPYGPPQQYRRPPQQPGSPPPQQPWYPQQQRPHPQDPRPPQGQPPEW